MAKIGPDNPCKACLAEGRLDQATERGQPKLLPRIRGPGAVHYRRKQCMEWAGFMPVSSGGEAKEEDAPDEEPERKNKKQKIWFRAAPPICATIYQIKDSRMCVVDCESKVDEDEDVELCVLRRNPAPENEPGEQLLEYKCYGIFKNHIDELGGKLDTYWLSYKEMAGGAGPVQTEEKVHEYERKYMAVRKAHYDAYFVEQAAFLAHPRAPAADSAA